MGLLFSKTKKKDNEPTLNKTESVGSLQKNYNKPSWKELKEKKNKIKWMI